MDSGDHSLLSGGMSIRDLVWIRAAREIRTKDETEFRLKRYEHEIEFKCECFKQIRNLLADIRSTTFDCAEYDTERDKLARQKAWLSLPSMAAAGFSPEDAVISTMSKKDKEAYLKEKEARKKAHEAKKT